MASILLTSVALKPRINKRNKQKHDHPSRQNLRNPYPYPKSTPTPLLLPPSTTTVITRDEAFDLVLADLESSVHRGAPLDPSILSSLLDSLARSRSPRLVPRLRRLIPRCLLRGSSALSSKLLHLHSVCGLIDNAHRLFDEMPRRTKANPFPWNSLISGYAELGLFEDAIALYRQMDEDAVEPDRFTFPRVLKACAGIGDVRLGEAAHLHAVRSGLAADPFVLNALVDMYAKCGDISRARRIFDKIPERDPVSWNSMITGYARHGLILESLVLLKEMVRSGVEPDSIAVSSLLAGFSSGKLGDEMHCWVLRRGLDCRLSVGNSLIGMYSKRNKIRRARTVFESMPEKDLVSWNAIISAHCRDRRALTMFQRMVDSEVVPDQVTFVSLLSSCANLGLVEEGRRLFSLMEERYEIMPAMEHYGCMVNLLGRAGLVEEAYEMALTQVPSGSGPTVWGALLYACSVHGHVGIGEVAAERLFDLEPDNEHNFELMIKIYKDAGRPEDAEEVMRLMKERGLEYESCEGSAEWIC